jgi:hypothetical protein
MLEVSPFSCGGTKFQIILLVDILKCFEEGLLTFNGQEVYDTVVDDLGKRQTPLICDYLVSLVSKICL